MNCSKSTCGGRLKITSTYSHAQAKFQRAVCEACRTTYCITSVLLIEPVTGKGKGALAKSENYLREMALRRVQERQAQAVPAPQAAQRTG